MTSPKIYVAGHQGMVGSAIVRTLTQQGTPASHIIGRTHAELDLCNQQAVQDFFEQERPTQVYLAAAKVGGIHANNTYPADFIYDNLMVQANVIHAAHTQPPERPGLARQGQSGTRPVPSLPRLPDSVGSNSFDQPE